MRDGRMVGPEPVLEGDELIDPPKRASLELRNVSMAYSTGELVLEDIGLSVEQGEFVSLLGPSGCGKTTLLNLVAGFFPPIAGQILLGDTPIDRPGSDRSMVFQDDAVFPWYTVAQNVEYALRVQGQDRRQRRQRVAELIKLVGLEGRDTAYPRELSGGMKKRVDLARALAPEPSVLLMDEPFAALDAMTKERMQSEFLKVWEGGTLTVLFVTHDIEEALLLSDRVLLMGAHPGRLQRDLTVPFERPRHNDLRTDPRLQDLRHDLAQSLALPPP